MNRARIYLSATALVSAGALALGPVATAAAQDELVVTNRESVQAFLDSDGSVDEARIYDQVAVYGTGSVTIENPVSTNGLRNLDGFGGYSVEDENMTVDLDVDGEERFRTVSDFAADDIPVSVEPEYRLDGQVVDANDLVGKSGRLDVTYTITNLTTQPTEVSYFTGSNEEVTTTVDVPIPLVGIFETVLPSTFSSVESGQLNVAGDGRGGHVLRGNLVLFPPIGSNTTTVGYTADITDGVLPEAQLDMVPVKPQEHYNFESGVASYSDVYSAGRQLGRGGSVLDDGLQQLADGAGDLMGGLQLIAAGSEELREGVADQLAPGSRELADGAADAADGAGQLAAGAGDAADGASELAAGLNDQLAPGAGELAGGAADAAEGASQLADGASQLWTGLRDRLAPGARELADGAADAADGATKIAEGARLAADGARRILGGVEGELVLGVNELVDGAEQAGSGASRLAGSVESELAPGIDRLVDGVEGELVPGVRSLVEGLDELAAGADRFRDLALGGIDDLLAGVGVENVGETDPEVVEELGQLAPAIWLIHHGLDEALSDGGRLEQLEGALNAINADEDGCSGTCRALIGLIIEGVSDELKPSLGDARDGLGRALDGILREDPSDPGLALGLQMLRAGITTGGLPEEGQEPEEGFETLRQGLHFAAEGAQLMEARLLRDDPTDPGLVLGLQLLQQGVRMVDPDGENPGLLQGLQLLEDGLNRDDPDEPGLLLGLRMVQEGIVRVDPTGVDPGLLQGLRLLDDGLNRGDPDSPGLALGSGVLAQGLSQGLAPGAADLAAGAAGAVDGAGQVAGGSGQLADGNSQLADGAGQLADGAGEAADGASQLADGNRQIADGSTELWVGLRDQLAPGAGELADGLEDAADGATELAEGTEEAADGSVELAEGAGDASTGFQDNFVAGFDELAAGGGTNLAVALAATERGATEALPYGAPDDAIATAAYSLTIAGSAGEGNQNLVRAVAAVVLLGLVAGGVAVLRRRATA